jgi:DNA (cytosine-5)-methyltransferase 1
MNKMTARSYCSGYLGLEMAVRAAFGDFAVLSHSDIKPAAVALLAHRYPDIPNLGDMRRIDYSCLDRADLMIGSWPCGPWSAAGKRLGEDDPRDLWPEFYRAIKATRPAIWFGENVARVVRTGELRRVATSLAGLGYVGAWVVRSAADVGACHLRKRCFVVAVDPAIHASGGGLEAWRAADPGPGQPSETGWSGPADSGSRPLTLLPTPKATDGTKGGPGMRGSSGDLFLPSAVQPRNFSIYTEAVRRHEQVLGRTAPAPRQISRIGSEQLSSRFTEWMMMLPEGWVCDVPGLVDSPRKSERNAQLSLLGDGVVPAQGAAAFRFLLDHMSQRLAGEVAA